MNDLAAKFAAFYKAAKKHWNGDIAAVPLESESNAMLADLRGAAALRAMHAPFESDEQELQGQSWCEHCSDLNDFFYATWPCETIQTLDGATKS